MNAKNERGVMIVSDKKVYIKISDGHSYFIETIEYAKTTLESMADNHADNGNAEEYEFSTVELTQEEFNNLPEFHGF
jgi:hypothetical protein